MKPMLCCVCGEEICDPESSAFNTCEDCLDNVHSDLDGFIESSVLGTGEQAPPADTAMASAS